MLYFIIFWVTIFFTLIAELSIKSKIKRTNLFILFSLLATLLPAAFAGFRDSGIGTDTLVYVDNEFAKFRHIHSTKEFLSLYNNGYFQSIELVYLFINFIVSRFTLNVNWLYFFANYIVVLFFYKAAYDNRNKAAMWLIMAFFLFLFYNHSLNLVRQSIALAMTVYAFKFFESKKWVKVIIWSIIIINTHNTGVFFLALPVIYLLCSIQNRYIRNTLKTISLLGLAFVFVFFDQILIMATLFGVISDKYLMYLSSESDTAIAKTELVVYILFIFLLFYARKYIKEKGQNADFYIYNKIIGTILFLTSLISRWANRISFYVNVTDCLVIPRALYSMSEKKKLYWTLQILVVLLLIIYWYWKFMVRGDGNTSTYTSKILGL